MSLYRYRYDEYHVDGERRYDVVRYTEPDDYLAFGNYRETIIGTIYYSWAYGDWYFRGDDLSPSLMRRLSQFMEGISPLTKQEAYEYPLAR